MKEIINQVINSRMHALKCANDTFEDLFKIIHSNEQLICLEYLENDSIKEITYGDVKKRSIEVGSALKKIVNPGEYIGLYMDNSLEWIACFWGILMAGAIPMLLNYRLSLKINQEIIGKLNIKKLIAKDKFLNNKFAYVETIDVNSLKVEEVDQDFEWANTICLSSSATSLKYKICLFDGASIRKAVLATKDILHLNTCLKYHYQGRLKQLLVLPLYHIFGLIAVYFWFSIFSRTFVLCPTLDKDTLIKTIKTHGVTHIFAVPLLWETLAKSIRKEFASLDEVDLKRLEKGLKLSKFLQNNFGIVGLKLSRKILKEVQDKLFGPSVICLISGGGPIRGETLELINSIGYPLYNGYGASEIGITSFNCAKKFNTRVNGSIGKPLKGVKYRLDEDDNLEVSTASCAKMIINENGTFTMGEYFNTCDFAKVVKDEYFLMGRSDDVVLAENGEKLSLDELEKNLKFSFDLGYCLICMNEKLLLILELKDFDEKDLEKLLNEIEDNKKVLIDLGARSFTAKYTTSNLLSEDAFKVSRKELETRIKFGEVELFDVDSFSNKSLELSELALMIRSLFASVLDLNEAEIAPDANFIFDLGGTSIEYLTLLEKINETYPLQFEEIEEKKLFTILDFEKYLKDLNRNE